MDKPDIFMPLYIGDYLAGTSRLTTELHGAYLLLIMDYWMNGPPPDNDQMLSSITKLTPDAWSNARGMLEQYFSISEGCWKHGRIEQELATASERKRSAREKAERAAAARWGKSSKDAPSNAPSIPEAMREECPSPSPSPVKPKGFKKNAQADSFSDDDMKCAVFMLESILKVQPDYKKPNMNKWADIVRLMRERDSRTHRDVCEVWKWARADSFWQKHIISPDKLRKKYDQLKANMRAPSNGNQGSTPKSAIERFMQQNYPSQDHERPMGGDDSVVWEQVDEPVR